MGIPLEHTGEMTTSAKKRKRRPQSPEGSSRIRTSVAVEEYSTEYDDQAWVAAANNIVAELARTNGLLDRSASVADGSRLAIDRLGEAMGKFMKEQGDMQELLLHRIRNAIRASAEAHPDMEEDVNAR
jgi:hypothetical protein